MVVLSRRNLKRERERGVGLIDEKAKAILES